MQRILELGKKVKAMSKSAWTEKDQIDNFLKKVKLMRSLEKSLNIRVISFTMKMEILLEPTSNKLMVEHAEFDEFDTHVLERFDTSTGNPVKKILLKLNLPDHKSILTDSKMEVKLKNFKKDAPLKLFKSTNQERYEHVGPEVTSSQDGKVYKMAKENICWLKISRCFKDHIQDRERKDKGTTQT
ncbi:hypothetical protein Tco_0461292 [Tanacetum coccineum]